jgi:hypothetical protein
VFGVKIPLAVSDILNVMHFCTKCMIIMQRGVIVAAISEIISLK